MRRNRFVVILPLALASMLLAAALWSLNGIAATRAESLLAPGKSPGPALSIAKIASAESITPAGQLIYVLVITNTGDVSATNVVVTDTLPDGLTLSASEPPAATQSGSTATWEFQEIAPGEKATVILTTTVSAPLPDGLPLVNIAAAVCDETLPVESDPVTVTVLAPAFALSKQPYTPTVRPGDWLTYTFRLTNTGHLTLTEPYTLLERLPAHTGYVTSTPPAEITEGLLLFTFASPLPPGETTEATLVLSVTEPLTHGWHLVNEEYFAFSPAVTPSVSGPAVTITVESAALEIGKFASPSPVPPGSLLTYTIAVSNTGDARGAAVQLILTDTWPGFTTFVSCAGGQACGADQVEGWVTWTLDVLPPNVTGWFTLTVNVSEGLVAGWWLTNQVTLTAQSVAPLTATAAVSVAHVPGVSLAPNGEASILPGETITYNHTLTNTGNGEDTFTITLGGLPAGWSGSVEPTSVSLGAGASAPVTVTVEVPTDALSGTVATAVVTATSSADPSVWATVTDRTTVRHRPGVALAPNWERAAFSGDIVTYTHILTNTGNGEDVFYLQLSSSLGQAALVPTTTYTLSPGVAITFYVQLTIPGVLSDQTGFTIITATSRGGAGPAVVTDTTFVKPYRIFLPVAIRNYPPAWARLTSFPQELTVYSLGICGQYMYAGTQQGVYVSTDGGRSWSQRLPGNVVRGVAVHPTICTLAYATTWGNYVYKTRDGGSTWTQLSSGLGGSQWSYALAFSRDGQRIYLGTGNKGVYQATVRTSSDNEQWTRVLNMDNAVPGLTVTSTATAQYVVYAAVWEAGVYWFNGTQWSAWSQQPSDRKVLKVAANPVNGMLFAGTNEKFFRWTGSDWASLTPSARTFDFAFHPPLNRIYAAQEGNGVLVSTDGGLNWTPMNTGMVPLPSQIRCLVVHEGYLYAGTTSGIWRYPLVP